jgi:hypothetical protein
MPENQLLNSALLQVLEETFENVQGIYLDRHTSILETLSTISAEQASRRTSDCASIAAHVEHMTFYIEVTIKYIEGERTKVNWEEIWQRVGVVSPTEWTASQERLKTAYNKARQLIESSPGWTSPEEFGGALGLIAHNAYHLGEIRQAICVIKSN